MLTIFLTNIHKLVQITNFQALASNQPSRQNQDWNFLVLFVVQPDNLFRLRFSWLYILCVCVFIFFCFGWLQLINCFFFLECHDFISEKNNIIYEQKEIIKIELILSEICSLLFHIFFLCYLLFVVAIHIFFFLFSVLSHPSNLLKSCKFIVTVTRSSNHSSCPRSFFIMFLNFLYFMRS